MGFKSLTRAVPLTNSVSGISTEGKAASLAIDLDSVKDKIWQSRISWRITLAVFLTIMTVQAGMLALTLKSYENDRLYSLQENVRTSIVPLLDYKVADPLQPPLSEELAQRLISSTVIHGLAIYSLDYNLIRFNGEPVVTALRNENDLSTSYRSDDGRNYEVVFRPTDLNGRPYYFVARLDSSSVVNEIRV